MKLLSVIALTVICCACRQRYQAQNAPLAMDSTGTLSIQKAGGNCGPSMKQPQLIPPDSAASLVARLKKETFILSKTKSSISADVQCVLDKIDGRHFSIADSDEAWQCCCDRSDTTLPDRSLIAFAKGARYAIVAYKTGGIGVMSHLLVLQLNSNGATAYWGKNGNGTNLTTVAGMLRTLESTR